MNTPYTQPASTSEQAEARRILATVERDCFGYPRLPLSEIQRLTALASDR
ncbi:hypothetical protein [Roseomonas mucosa]|nr:hypothetical protein [Roseomonas mucosa]UZO91728.1 hypothetical protein RMP42_06020 [Roseomonas mucosa]